MPKDFDTDSARAANAIKWAVGNVASDFEGLSPFLVRRIKRVRRDLVGLERAIGEALDKRDALVLDRLTRAYERLFEVERKLSGRPDPGSLRQAKSRSRPDSPGPIAPG